MGTAIWGETAIPTGAVADNGAESQGTTSGKEIQTEQRPRGEVALRSFKHFFCYAII